MDLIIKNFRRTVRALFCVLAALISAPAICFGAKVAPGEGSPLVRLGRFFAVSPLVLGASFLCIFALFFFAFYKKTLGFRVLPFAVSLILSAMDSIGRSFASYGSFYLISANTFQRFAALWRFVGAGLIFYVFLAALYAYFDGEKQRENIAKISRPIAFFEKHVFLSSFLLILLFWSPYLIFYYPGTLEFDVVWQLDMFNHINFDFSDHHPVFSTVFYGLCMKLGCLFGSSKFGAFLCVFTESAGLALAMANSIRFLKKRGLSFKVRMCILAFFALNPLLGFYSQFAIKDVQYAAVLLFFATELCEACLDPKKYFSSPRLLLLCLAGLLTCLFRHNGIYVVVLSLAGAFFIKCGAKTKFKIVCLAIGFFAVMKVYTDMLIPSLGIYPAYKRESYSVMFQQTARYFRDHGDEVTQDEYDAIDPLLRCEDITERYDPMLADPVKGICCVNESEPYAKYMKAWAVMFLKHPETYFSSFFAGSYVYWYPDGEGTSFALYDTESVSHPHINTGAFDISRSGTFDSCRKVLENFSEKLQSLPVLGLLFSQGAYTWVAIIFFAYAISKKCGAAIAGMLPLMLTVLICCASPVNGMMRYYIPCVAMLPLCAAGCVLSGEKERACEMSDRSANN